VQRVAVGEDLDASVGRVADDFAPPRRNQDRFGNVELHAGQPNQTAADWSASPLTWCVAAQGSSTYSIGPRPR
jgi:hypothetical protein